MHTIWDEGTRKDILVRFGRLTPQHKPQWGKMNPAQMMSHCTAPLCAAMGETQVAGKKTIFRFPAIRYLIIYKMPWPKSTPTAPEFIRDGPVDFESSHRALVETLERFSANHGKGLQPHPAFGALSQKDWGCLTWRHLDHHLTQFGL